MKTSEGTESLRESGKGMEICEGKIDKEWVELLMTAKQLGLTIEEIQDFIRQSKAGLKIGQFTES